MAKFYKTAAIGLAAASMAVAAPASATVFEYEFTNGDILTIDSDTASGTWIGNTINASFTSPDLAGFTGGETPNFMAILTSLDGTRLIGGAQTTDNPGKHPQKLIFNGSKNVNLWSHWGNPIQGGDYRRNISSFSVATPPTGSSSSSSGGTNVPAPGMLGLFGLALAALGLGWRRRKTAAA